MIPNSDRNQNSGSNRYDWPKGLVVAAMTAALSLSCFTPRVEATSETAPCSVEPRSIDDLLASVTSAQTPTSGDNNIHTPEPLPAHSPADAETIADITAVVHELESCINAGDQLRVYALFSGVLPDAAPLDDEVIAEITSDLRALEDATPVPLPEDARLTLIGPWNVDLLADGRVMAAVEFTYPDSNTMPSSTKVVFFSQHSGHWVIDEFVDTIWLTEGGPVPVADIVGTPPGA